LSGGGDVDGSKDGEDEEDKEEKGEIAGDEEG
jgi:hypothetical protein